MFKWAYTHNQALVKCKTFEKYSNFIIFYRYFKPSDGVQISLRGIAYQV